MANLETALLSVHDKTGLVDFATSLHERGVELLSTGGTAAALRDAGLPVTPIAEHTGQSEMLGGRVKTLHPKVFAGLLARRDDEAQMQELVRHGVEPIDLVAVNLYPFEATVAEPSHTLAEALEQIDIGGVSLLRAAAKNAPGVVVVVDPGDYPEVVRAIEDEDLSLQRRLQWARRAIAHTSAYEAAISNYLAGLQLDGVDLDATPDRQPFPASLTLPFRRLQELRYGENPHQRAAFYAAGQGGGSGLAAAEQLHGKELSYNNILDVDAARQLASALSRPGAAVIKHNNPCGAASADSLLEAYRQARATDPMSAFGGIVAVNEDVDGPTAEEIAATFIEVVVAPGYDAAALEVLQQKKALRVLRAAAPEAGPAGTPLRDLRSVDGGLLVQDRDPGASGEHEQWRCVSERQPSPQEEAALRFAWTVCPYVRSNAIVIARDRRLIGVGAGQMSRVDAGNLAVSKARQAGHELAGSAAASDAFFPFADGVEALAEAGVTAVVQPGGSKRDPEVIEAANRLQMAMVFTGSRHFRH